MPDADESFATCKYFAYMRYKSSDWKAIHLVYFPAKEILYSHSLQGAKAKLLQNHFSIHFMLLTLVVVLSRNWMG